MTTLQSLLERVQARRHAPRGTQVRQIVDSILGASVRTSGDAAKASEAAPASISPRSATQYSSQPPTAEHIDTSRLSSAASAAPLAPVFIRPESFVAGHTDIVRATGSAEFQKAKTFGELLELTLALRPR